MIYIETDGKVIQMNNVLILNYVYSLSQKI